mmetsp:Transcript_13834/g.44497  ORF Transcript_13834/g.44497 Transcript_13834/m.44497 type:complete len:473 (-) Transcript_13834:106-1524(-)
MRPAPFLLLLLPAPSLQKISDGVAKLSSQDTEQYLTKFSFSPRVASLLNISFHVAEREYFDRHQHELTLCLYSDTDWPRFRRAMTKGSLCSERQRLASWSAKVQPEVTYRPGTGYRHDFDWAGTLTAPKGRAHYWYAMLMDCYLEEYDAHPPPLNYRLIFMNGESHLPADESGMATINGLALLGMLAYGALYFFSLYSRFAEQRQLHLITVVFALAYALQAASVLCELCHLRAFAADGKGLRWRHTWLALDFGSGLLQSISELSISLLLISLAFGWTLGLESQEPLAGLGGKLLEGLHRPARLLRGLQSPSVWLLSGIGGAQLLLQAAGRRYEEDFNHFHDHEHWPGLALLAIRLGLCALFAFALRRSLSLERQPEVASFLRRLLVYGLCWFLCLPLLVLLAALLPPYRRHQLVAGGAIVLQAAALALLSRLFVTSSEFYKISSLSHLGFSLEGGPGLGGGASRLKGKLCVD